MAQLIASRERRREEKREGEMYTRVQGERKKVEIIGTVDTGSDYDLVERLCQQCTTRADGAIASALHYSTIHPTLSIEATWNLPEAE